jgi:hypothetical protein
MVRVDGHGKRISSRRGRGNVGIPKGFPKSVGRVESRLHGFPCFPYSVISMACFSRGRYEIKRHAANRCNVPHSPRNARRCSSLVNECIGDWALVCRGSPDRVLTFTGTDRGLLRSVLGPWSPVPKCELSGAPISVEEHTSMAPRPRRQSQNPPLQRSSAIPALPWPS